MHGDRKKQQDKVSGSQTTKLHQPQRLLPTSNDSIANLHPRRIIRIATSHHAQPAASCASQWPRAERPSTNLGHEGLVLPQSSAHGAFGGDHNFSVHPHTSLGGKTDVLVLGGVQSLEREVFEAGAEVVHTKAVRQRGVYLQGITSKLLPLQECKEGGR